MQPERIVKGRGKRRSPAVRANRLVRIYDEFTYRGDGSPPILTGFRAASIVTNTHTDFQIEDISLDWD